jgi:hypothetical protein
MKFSSTALRLALKNTLPWYGAIFAGVYAALYARFSSQWTYLAALYYQIKATEAQVVAGSTSSSKTGEIITSMKASFIEDADDLHLALKPMFAALIRTWSQDEKVKVEFVEYAPGGQLRFNSLLEEVNSQVHKYEKSFQKKES